LISANGFLVTSETERRLRVAARAMSLSSACMLTSPGYNPFAGRSGEERRDWLLFVLWLTRQQHSAAGAWRHVEWVLRLRPPRRSSPRNSRAWSLSSSSLPCSGLPQPGEKRNDALGVFEGEFALMQRGAVAWVGLPGGDNRFAQPDGEAGRPAGGQPPAIQPKSLKY
jgi:hypothetical protein